MSAAQAVELMAALAILCCGMGLLVGAGLVLWAMGAR